jgi:hypothetical protein
MLDALIISPVAPISGVSRPAVISASEPLGLALAEDSGHPALQVDGTIVRRMQPGESVEVRLRPRAGLVVRFDPERYQRRSGVKLSLLDLPFLPEEMRDVLPLTGSDPLRNEGEDERGEEREDEDSRRDGEGAGPQRWPGGGALGGRRGVERVRRRDVGEDVAGAGGGGRGDEDVPGAGGEEVGDVGAGGAADERRDAGLAEDVLDEVGLGLVPGGRDLDGLAVGHATSSGDSVISPSTMR